MEKKICQIYIQFTNDAAKILNISPFLCYFYLQKLPKSLSSDALFELKFHQNPFSLSQGSALYPTGGAYDAPPDILQCSSLGLRCLSLGAAHLGTFSASLPSGAPALWGA